VTHRLQTLGAKVQHGHADINVTAVDAVVISSAVKDDNPESDGSTGAQNTCGATGDDARRINAS
jgi:UDP-N-acetylmuramate--alanine ligase